MIESALVEEETNGNHQAISFETGSHKTRTFNELNSCNFSQLRNLSFSIKSFSFLFFPFSFVGKFSDWNAILIANWWMCWRAEHAFLVTIKYRYQLSPIAILAVVQWSAVEFDCTFKLYEIPQFTKCCGAAQFDKKITLQYVQFSLLFGRKQWQFFHKVEVHAAVS